MMVDRNFSIQRGLIPRRGTYHDKVGKILFCGWNLPWMRGIDRSEKNLFCQSIDAANYCITAGKHNARRIHESRVEREVEHRY